MATNQNVKFYFTSTLEKYTKLQEKNPLALYFITDEATGQNYLFKGDKLIAAGHEATEQVAGLMSAEDKAKLESLVAASGTINLTAVDGTIKLADTEGGKSIGVAVSTQKGNVLVAVEDGLFVPHPKAVSIPEYSIEKQETAEEGFATSYKLKKTVDGEVSYVGDTINIAKDMVLHGATLEIVTEAGVPYDGAVVGDPYIDMAFNDAAKSHIYIPVNGLVDTYTAGECIEIVDGKISVKIAEESNGLVAVDGALMMKLATATSAGALSAVDKSFIDSIPEIFASKKFVEAIYEKVKYEISGSPYGTLVNYGETEIRIMCPADAEFVKQSVGAGGDANTYYVTFRTYVPNDNIVGYIEHLNGKADAEILADLKTDEHGRRYQSTWLGIAKYDEKVGSWTYYGATSTESKYIGWDYQIDWYDKNNVMIDSDSIRINLSNEGCHNASTPYYVSALEAKIDSANESYIWGEL